MDTRTHSTVHEASSSAPRCGALSIVSRTESYFWLCDTACHRAYLSGHRPTRRRHADSNSPPPIKLVGILHSPGRASARPCSDGVAGRRSWWCGRAVTGAPAAARAARRPLTELITLGRALKRRTIDVLAYFDRPGTSNGVGKGRQCGRSSRKRQNRQFAPRRPV